MHFAYPLPPWGVLLVVTAVVLAAIVTYHGTLVPLAAGRRILVVTLRAAALALLVLFCFRPVVAVPPADSGDASVAVVIDTSRSMRVADAGGQPRIARAAAVVRDRILPALAGRFRTDLFAAGDGIAPARLDGLDASAHHSELGAAIASLRDRYRGTRLAGVVLVSDGGDTSTDEPARTGAGAPVVAVGIGSADGLADREVLSIGAGDPHLADASIDLAATVASRGFGRAPFPVRLLRNGAVVDTRRLVPTGDGVPIEVAFSAAPDPLVPTTFAVEIPVADGEAVPENNTRRVVVGPAGRRRRVLVVEGAPGFEHAFMKRALARDPGLEVDAVVRKGTNADAQGTFFVQAAGDRAPGLLAGFPASRAALFAYDAVALANVDALTTAQLALVAAFVSERGGGLLVMGGRSFSGRGLAGTPLEDALPVEPTDRRGAVRASIEGAEPGGRNKLVLTPEGERHPVMRAGGAPAETRRAWDAQPPLASSAPVGGPRPGATVLAVAESAGGGLHPLVAVQRYGRGRAMVFAGEASWRWRMLRPSDDRTYEFFWRQAVRWLATPSPDPVTMTLAAGLEAGDVATLSAEVRDREFAPVAGSRLAVTVTGPTGDARSVEMRPDGSAPGRFTGIVRFDADGVYRVHGEVPGGAGPPSTAEQWVSVGDADREFAAPRLNDAVLRRIARATGGAYLAEADAGRVLARLEESVATPAAPVLRDLWHEPWAYALVVACVAVEWVLRRRWGLR